jgi:hypothetical protein
VAAQIAGSMAAGLVGGRLLLSDPSDSVPGDGGGAFPQRNADISFGQVLANRRICAHLLRLLHCKLHSCSVHTQALLAEAVVACMLCYVRAATNACHIMPMRNLWVDPRLS